MNKYPMQFGRYLLINKIASGGMAEIFKAKLQGVEGFEKTVAIKRILPFWSEDRNFINMLVDEAKVLVHLNHPNIVQVYELGRVDKIYFIAMEYVDGLDLRRFSQYLPEKIDERNQHVILSMMLEVLEGLHYAHNRYLASEEALGVIHRDISPQNILVSSQGEVKVTDFGIAKAVTQTHETQTGVLKGKFAYMSPEQAMGKALDKRSDLFAWGIVCFELLFNQRPFEGKTDIETIDKIRQAQIEWPQQKAYNLFFGVKELLIKTLSKNPEDRFQDAQDLIVALEDLLPNKRRLNQLQLREYFNEQLLLEKMLDDRELYSIKNTPQTLSIDKSTSEEKTVSLVKTAEQDFWEASELDKAVPSLSQKLHPVVQKSSFFNKKNLQSFSKFFLVFGLFAVVTFAIYSTPRMITFFSKEKKDATNFLLTGSSYNDNEKEAKETEAVWWNTIQNLPRLPIDYYLSFQSIAKEQMSELPVTLEVSVSPAAANIIAKYPGGNQSGVGNLTLPPLQMGTSVELIASLSGYDEKRKKITLSGNEVRVKTHMILKKEEQQFGTISVNSSPVWGKVFVGRNIVDVPTPLKSRKIAVGSYRVTVKSADGQVVISGSARIRPDRHTVCQASFGNVPRVQCH